MLSLEEIQNILKKSGLSIVVDESSYTKTFTDIGIDSLDLYAFLSEVELEKGIKIEDNEIETISSLKSLNELLCCKMENKE